MICPKCKAEYRRGYTSCADCGVELVESVETAGAEPEQEPVPGDPNEDPFCSFWKGDDARLHVELCTLLDEAGIGHTTVFKRDRLFNLTNYAAFQLGVPFSQYRQAESVVREAFGLDPEDPDAIKALSGPRLLPAMQDRIRKLPAMLTPSPEQDRPGPPPGEDSVLWTSDDAGVEIWSGEDESVCKIVAASLTENDIGYRSKNAKQGMTIRVLPENQQRAREIVREIVEETPLE